MQAYQGSVLGRRLGMAAVSRRNLFFGESGQEAPRYLQVQARGPPPREMKRAAQGTWLKVESMTILDRWKT